MLAFARLVRGVNDLQIANTLQSIGDRGRIVLRETFDRLETANASRARSPDIGSDFELGPSRRIFGMPVRRVRLLNPTSERLFS